MGTMRTITGVGITLRMVTNMITRVVPLTHTALDITRTCTTGIVSPFTAAAITAATATPIEDHRGLDLISECAAIRSAVAYGNTNAVAKVIVLRLLSKPKCSAEARGSGSCRQRQVLVGPFSLLIL